MTQVDQEVGDGTPTMSPRGQQVLTELSATASALDATQAELDRLLAYRVQLYQEGQALEPRLTQLQLATAARVTPARVTQALTAERAKAAKAATATHT